MNLIEGVFPACDVFDKLPVHITKAQEGSDLCLVCWGLRLAKRVYIGLVDLKQSRFDHVSEVLYFFLKEVTFVYL